MAKKFFYNKVHNTKRTVINIIIISICVIGIIICFLITSNFQGEINEKSTVNIKSVVNVEVNDEIPKKIFFSKIENFDIKNIKITYPKDFDISKPGEYTVTITIDKKDYTTKLVVTDTTKPVLQLKEVTITENHNYFAKDFVVSCTDNSKDDCIIEFYTNTKDDNGNDINYANYTKEGIYPIKISASDKSGNQTVLETNLIIKKEGSTENPSVTTPTCKYGDNKYNDNDYILALDVTNGGCATSLDLYYNNDELNKIMEAETSRIIKDAQKLNIGTDSMYYVDRLASAISNLSGKGIVGYELEIVYKIEKDDKLEVIAQYKLDINGKRIFSINKYNLPE